MLFKPHFYHSGLTGKFTQKVKYSEKNVIHNGGQNDLPQLSGKKDGKWIFLIKRIPKWLKVGVTMEENLKGLSKYPRKDLFSFFTKHYLFASYSMSFVNLRNLKTSCFRGDLITLVRVNEFSTWN